VPVRIALLFCAARSIIQSFDGFCVSRQRPYQSVVFGRYSKPGSYPGTICPFFNGRIEGGEPCQPQLTNIVAGVVHRDPRADVDAVERTAGRLCPEWIQEIRGVRIGLPRFRTAGAIERTVICWASAVTGLDVDCRARQNSVDLMITEFTALFVNNP
jgi:hypothetical protein